MRHKTTPCVICPFVLVWALSGCASSPTPPPAEGVVGDPAMGVGIDSPQIQPNGAPRERLNVTVGVMSQCPYGNKALKNLIPVVKGLGGWVDLNVEYIGREKNGVLTSMHGESEVIGDMLQLCASQHGTYESWLGFVSCQTANWKNTPQGWQHCARENGLNDAALCSCVEGSEGEWLLRASFKRSSDLGMKGSPTIYVGEERYTGGRLQRNFEWSLCGLLGHELPYCADVPPPPSVPVIVLGDRRCTHEECDASSGVEELRLRCPGITVGEVDYNSTRGRELFAKAKAKLLPALLFGDEIEQDRDCLRSLRGMKRTGDVYLKGVGRFDPIKGEWIERPEVPIRFLVDVRCQTRECSSFTRFESFIKKQVSRATITHVDYDTAEGRALWKRLVSTWEALPSDERQRDVGLPIALFGKAIENAEVYDRLSKRLVTVGEEYAFQLGPWDPTAEICDNGVDDDGDRRVDCRDPGCRGNMSCRPEKRRQLDLFVMSQCPYGNEVLKAMSVMLGNFGRKRKQLDFRLQFVGQVNEEGELSTMHGPDELAEDLRQICAQHLYRKNYQFMDYVTCRVQNPRSNEWEQCVTGPMKVDAIARCAEGGLGERLLRKSMELANTLGFRGSPSWLLNNRYPMKGRNCQAITEDFCKRNSSPGCSVGCGVPPQTAPAVVTHAPGGPTKLPGCGESY